MLKKCCLALALLVAGLTPSAGQTEHQFIGFRLNDGARQSSFSFDYINNLIIIPVVMNDSIKLNFILDTGVRTTLITNNEPGNLELRFTRQVQVAGLGIAHDIKAFVVPDVKLQLPGITGHGQTLIVLGEDYLKLQNHLGKEVHGILGYDFFNHFVVRINYASKRITVFAPDQFKPSRRYSPVDLVIKGGRPYAHARIVQTNGTVAEGMFLIDTGASHSLLLETDRKTDVYLPIPHIPAIIGYGLGGEVSGNLARIERLDWGGFAIKRVIASYGSGLYVSSADSAIGRIGSIGGEIISRFTAIFDYKNQKLYLRPNNVFRKPFDYNMSSMDIVAGGKDFKTFTVVNVNRNSAAWNAGVRPGDIVLSINELGAGELNLEQINAIFRSNPGAVVHMLVRRDKQVLSVKFRLKRLI
ncbi:MAG TPA: aspartyl protease family protein [Bacteroidales bacterium]|nr:aspartyl protease family protein [Bacteroidales bacterium]